MAYTEKEVEKKTLSEISSLVLGHEQKIKELANAIGLGMAKPADMMSVNSDLALLKKVLDKKMKEQNHTIQRGQQKAPSAPLKSFDDYMKNKKK
jgi:HJR/Mrr/RecB family endonuclease